NWMWPRHTGDFSLLRAYVGPDGKPADYSPDNVSFHPKKFLKIDPRGVDREDLVFLLGYPGRTYRHRSSFFIAYEKEVRMPYVINLYQWMISVMEKIADQDRSVAIKLAPRIKGLSNVLKNYQGKLKGLNRIKLVLKKREQEDKLQAFIDSKPETKKKYGPLLGKIRDFYAQQRHVADYELLMDYLLRGSTLLNTAYTVYEASIEGQKKDTDRKPKYMKRNFSRSKKRLLLRLQNFDQQADAIILKELLNRALKLETRRISAIDKRAGWSESGKSIVNLSQYKKNIDAFLKNAFEKTRLTESEFIRQLFARSAAELEMLEDPFLELSISLYPEYKKLDEKSKKRKGIFDDLASQLIEIKRAWQGQEFIPDANSTLRLTFGRIRGYSPADAVDFTPLTTLGGVIEKNTGQIPFQVPRKILDLYEAADFGAFQHPVLKDVPVAILYNADTTGGNSGSPVLNARGELVGLNYDRTFEATINDFAWNEQYSRSIGVDIRYILWLIKKFGGAHHLLKEMGVH
ncbi:MAG: S46 family peptidase, partial [Candidatus Aminicenantes bacterium]|nr:S46 family peptidase [Candidatus Aminicenantes bacterium]